MVVWFWDDVLVGFLVVAVVCVPRCQGGGWFGFGVAVVCTLGVWWFCVGIWWFCVGFCLGFLVVCFGDL